jgi:superfamily I DNA/RNA helicase
MAKSCTTREYQQCRSQLSRAGHRAVVAKLDALLSQAVMDEELTAARLTKHGESRLPNVEKFALDDGFRLVTQFIGDGDERWRVFLFAGSHDETERWLDRRRGYKHVINTKDHRIELVPLSAPIPDIRLINPDLSPQLTEQPLLRHMTAEDWDIINVSQAMKNELMSIAHFEYSDDRVMKLLMRLTPFQREALFDVMVATNDADPDKARARLDALRGHARVATDAEVAQAIKMPINADQYITFEDPEKVTELLRREAWEDWMLFLHPAQSNVATKTYDGPARLRGVSGSGKTSIVVHRARMLARRYEMPVLIVTLTSSLAKLITHLVESLCGVERNLITCTTAQALVHDVVRTLNPKRYRSLLPQPDEHALRKLRLEHIRSADVIGSWKDCRLPKIQAERHLDEEFVTVQEDYLLGERDLWVSKDRRGRGIQLPADARRRLVEAIASYESRLKQMRTADPAILTVDAIDAALAKRGDVVNFDEPKAVEAPFARCVLVDEGQDLSANELRLLMALTAHVETDAFFVASDAAQRIYKRQSSLGSIGIDVRGRAVVFRKNYRNTAETLRAARSLLEAFDVIELEDGSEAPRIEVDFATREGSPPEIIRFKNRRAEVQWIANNIAQMRRTEVAFLGSGIGVIAASGKYRDAVASALGSLSIPTTPLRHDVLASSEAVKVSTIETAKGHEFSVVFVPGLIEGVLPLPDADEEQVRIDAARLYVAMTRARERVIMTWSQDDGSRPSRLLTAMMKFCRQGAVTDSGVLRMDSL